MQYWSLNTIWNMDGWMDGWMDNEWHEWFGI